MIYFLKGGWLIALNYRVSPQLACITFLYRSPPRPSRSRRLSSEVKPGTWRWIGESVTTVSWERCRGESNKWKIWCWSWHCDIRADFFRHIFCTGMCLYAILRVSQHHVLSRRSPGVFGWSKIRGTLKLDLVGGWPTDLPLWKIWVVNGKDDIPYIMENKTCSKPPTRDGSAMLNMSGQRNQHMIFLDIWGSVHQTQQKTLGPVFKEFPTLHTCKQSENSGKIPQ